MSCGEISNTNGRYKLKKYYNSRDLVPCLLFLHQIEIGHTTSIPNVCVSSQNQPPSSYIPPPTTHWDQELSPWQPRWWSNSHCEQKYPFTYLMKQNYYFRVFRYFIYLSYSYYIVYGSWGLMYPLSCPNYRAGFCQAKQNEFLYDFVD